VDVTTAGTYTASLFYTGNQGGTIDFVSSNSETGESYVELKGVEVPSTEHYHNWGLATGLFEATLPAGPQIITLTVTSIGGDGTGQFGNIMYLDFVPKSRRLRG